MLQTFELTRFFENELNADKNADDTKVRFKIHNSVGVYNPNPTELTQKEQEESQRFSWINGVLSADGGDNPPISDFSNVVAQYSMEFVVPASLSKRKVETVDLILHSFITKFNGTKQKIGIGNWVFQFQEPVFVDISQQGQVGVSSVCRINFLVDYNEDAVSSIDEVLKIDGIVIPIENGYQELVRTGVTNAIHGRSTTQSQPIQQTLQFVMDVPYKCDNPKVVELRKDAAGASLSKSYLLEYTDGITYPENAPLIKRVTLFGMQNVNSESPKIVYLRFTFQETDDGQGTQYFLGLLSNQWGKNATGRRGFNDNTDRINWFETRVQQGAPFVRIKAPNIDSQDSTKQIYYNETNQDLFKLLNLNYAVIKVVSDSSTRYIFYDVINPPVGAENQVMYDLKQDPFQTFYQDPNFWAAPCLIRKAHLNRWVDNGNGTVSFDCRPESLLFQQESLQNLPKRHTKRTQLKLYAFGRADVDDWLNNEVAFWVNVYVDKNRKWIVGDTYHSGKTEMDRDTTILQYTLNEGRHTTDLGMMCYPVYKGNKRIKVVRSANNLPGDPAQSIIIGSPLGSGDPMVDLRSNNDNSSYFYNVKFSLLSPIRMRNANVSSQIVIDSNGDLVMTESLSNTSQFSFFTPTNSIAFATDFNITRGMFTQVSQDATKEVTTNFYQVNNQMTFSKTDIVNKPRNTAFNPKLLSQNFKELSVVSPSGESFVYDIQKIGTNSFNFLYTEPLQPEITKSYLRLNAPMGLYIGDTTKSYLGLVDSTDNSLSYVNDQYGLFLADNKNSQLQAVMRIVQSAGMGFAGGAMSSQFATTERSIASANFGMAGAAIGGITSLIDRSLTIDNMKNAPSMLKNASGNVIFNMFVSTMKLFVDEHSPLENELSIADDQMFLNGFTLNRIDSAKNYDKIRKNFNYVECDLQEMDGVDMSNAARDELRKIFSQGVRIFYTDDVVNAYSHDNNERWLLF